jgi:hypothetical protein
MHVRPAAGFATDLFFAVPAPRLSAEGASGLDVAARSAQLRLATRAAVGAGCGAAWSGRRAGLGREEKLAASPHNARQRWWVWAGVVVRGAGLSAQVDAVGKKSMHQSDGRPLADPAYGGSAQRSHTPREIGVDEAVGAARARMAGGSERDAWRSSAAARPRAIPCVANATPCTVVRWWCGGQRVSRAVCWRRWRRWRLRWCADGRSGAGQVGRDGARGLGRGRIRVQRTTPHATWCGGRRVSRAVCWRRRRRRWYADGRSGAGLDGRSWATAAQPRAIPRVANATPWNVGRCTPGRRGRSLSALAAPLVRGRPERRGSGRSSWGTGARPRAIPREANANPWNVGRWTTDLWDRSLVALVTRGRPARRGPGSASWGTAARPRAISRVASATPCNVVRWTGRVSGAVRWRRWWRWWRW